MKINERTSRLLAKNIEDDLMTLSGLKDRYSLDGSLIIKLQKGNKETYTKDVMIIQHALNLIQGALEKLEKKV